MSNSFTAGPPLSPRRNPFAQPPKGKKPRRKSPFRWVGRFLGLVIALGVVGAGGAAVVAYHYYEAASDDLPTLDGLRHYQPRIISRVYAGDDALISELATERRIFVPLTAIPPLLRQSFVSAEDQKFWSHHGIDPVAMGRAAMTDVAMMGTGHRPLGASTITQQVAKNMLLNNDVSLHRKVREIALALRIEQTLSKDRILELYLNEIYLGLGAYGVAAAGQTYFNKNLPDLTIAECAFLAALPKGPNNYDPFKYPAAAKARRDWVIERLHEDHAITAEQAAEAKAQPLVPSVFHRQRPVIGSEWFAEDVRRQLLDKFGNDALTAGLSVQTSLSPPLQETADKVLRAGLMLYDRRHGGYRGPQTHIEGGEALQVSWAASLARLSRPAGMLDDWKYAVVLEVSPRSATIGWLDRDPGQAMADAVPHTGHIDLADSSWARRARGRTVLGGTPRRMIDIVRPGDVIMAEEADHGGSKLYLRQVPLVQGALVSLEPANGRVLALSGGWRFEASQFDRVTQAQRQPGSSFKPFVYLAAMEKNISPTAEFEDAPFEYNAGSAGIWRPSNYEHTFNGPTPLHTALSESLNLVTIRLAQQITMEQVAKTAIAFHVVDQMPHYLPVALGAVDTTIMRMAGAYASLAAGGKEVIPSLIDGIEDRDGHVIYRAPGVACRNCLDSADQPMLQDERAQLSDPQSVFQLVTMMEGVTHAGTGKEAGMGLGRPIAGKTGTTQDFKDAWFVGFTPDLVTAVWIGYDQPAGLGDKQTGGLLAGPVWHDYMEVALRDRPKLEFRMPSGLTMQSWAGGTAVDAFKPGQGWSTGGGVASTGGEMTTPIVSTDGEGGQGGEADNGSYPGAQPDQAPTGPGAASAGSPPGASGGPMPPQNTPQNAPPQPPPAGGGGSGGVDSNLGGLY